MFRQATEYGNYYFEGERADLVEMMNLVTKKYAASNEDTRTFSETSIVPIQKKRTQRIV